MAENKVIKILNKQGEQEVLADVKTLIYQLQISSEASFVFNGEKVNKKEVEIGLQGWASARYPEIFNIDYFTSEDYSLVLFLSTLLKQLQVAQPETNLPTLDKLADWQAKLKEHEDWVASLTYVDDTAELDYLEKQLDLTSQIQLISQIQNQTKQQLDLALEQNEPLQQLKKHWQNYLSPEQQEEILTAVVEQTTYDITNAQLTAEHQDPQESEAVKNHRQASFNQDFFRQSLDNLCQADAEIATALPRTQRNKLAQALQKSNLAETDASSLAQAQLKTLQARARLGLNREKLAKKVGQTLRLDKKTSLAYVDSFLLFLPTNPTQRQVKQAVQKSFDNLSVLTNVYLTAYDVDVQAAQQNLLPLFKNYAVSLALAQPENWRHMPVSQQAKVWAKKISKLAEKNDWEGLQNLNPIAVENLLRGMGTEDLRKVLANRGIDISKYSPNSIVVKNPKTPTDKLLSLFFLVAYIEKLAREKKLPWSLRITFKAAALKYSFLSSLNINPFKLSFFSHYQLGPGQEAVAKLKGFDKKWDYLKKKSRFDFVFPFLFKFKQTGQRFYSKRWQFWGNFINKLAPPNSNQHNFLYNLPDKLKPSYLLKPIHWSRIGMGKFMSWAGSKLGNRFLGNTFSFLGKSFLNHTFKGIGKKLLTKGVSLALKGIIGASTGGIGAAVGFGLTILSFLGLNSKKLKKLLRRIAQGAAILIGAAIGWFASHIATLFGIVVGGAVGGVFGAFIGGTVGFFIDGFISSLGGVSGALSTAAGFAGNAAGFLPITAGGFTLSAASAGVIVGSAVGGTVIINHLVHQHINTAFVAPPDITAAIPAEKQPLILQKTALPAFAGPGDFVTYTISVTTGTGNITSLTITDYIDTRYLTNVQIDPPASYNPSSGTITIEGAGLTGPGSTLHFSYTAQVKESVNSNALISNKATATAVYEGQIIKQTATFTLNSDGSDIAQRAREIAGGLERGFWDFYNRSTDYPELFDDDEFACCPNHCYSCSDYPNGCEPDGCAGDPQAIQKADSMFWCTWLVIKAYEETGHEIGKHLGVSSMKKWFDNKGKFLPSSTPVSQLKPGYVIFFKKGSSWAHVGIICNVSLEGIEVCEANNYCNFCNYTASKNGGYIQDTASLIIGGFGTP
jgi:hypothetical protein